MPPLVQIALFSFLTKLAALKTHCICDDLWIDIDHQFVRWASFKMCYSDERRLAIEKKFKNSVRIDVLVYDCSESKNTYGNHEIITKDAYRRGSQTIKFEVGQELYELTYLVR